MQEREACRAGLAGAARLSARNSCDAAICVKHCDCRKRKLSAMPPNQAQHAANIGDCRSSPFVSSSLRELLMPWMLVMVR